MEIMKIGVLGAGQMGMGIAQAAAMGGYQVIVRDIKEEFCQRGLASLKKTLEGRVAKNKLTAEEADCILERIAVTEAFEKMAECDMVIEAAPENLDLKQSLFEELGKICKPETILCTNTSSISVAKIMERCSNPARCIGMHFFFPVPVMRLVELVRFHETSDETITAVQAVAERMKKSTVLCKTDTPGFIVNRCLFALLLEAVHCYEDGVASAEDIDTALKLGLNHPLGPFEMMDLSGVDTFPHVCESLESLPVTDWSTPDAVKKLISEGRFGRKNGAGWYTY